MADRPSGAGGVGRGRLGGERAAQLVDVGIERSEACRSAPLVDGIEVLDRRARHEAARRVRLPLRPVHLRLAVGDAHPIGEVGEVTGRRVTGVHGLAFQQNPEYAAPVWTPDADRPGDQQMMVHLDMGVPDTDALEQQRLRVLELGGAELLDRSDDPGEPLYVFADPAGHPFCIFVA